MDIMKKLFLFIIITVCAFAAMAQDNSDPARSAHLLLTDGKLAEAQSSYFHLYQQDSTRLDVLHGLANIEFKRGYRNKASTYYQKIIRLDSNNFNAYKQLASLMEDDSAANKLQYLKKANQLHPIDADVVTDLCRFYFKMNNYKQASDILAPALAADTGNLNLLMLKIPISMAEKRYNYAIKIGESILNRDESSTMVTNQVANSYLAKLDYRNALRYFLKIKPLFDNQEELFYNIASCYLGLRDYNNAAKYVNQAIDNGISTKTASYYALLGESLENSNKVQDAINAYKRGLLFENNGSLYYNIALTYENKLNDKKNAIANYNLYLANYKGIKRNPKLASYIKYKIEELKR